MFRSSLVFVISLLLCGTSLYAQRSDDRVVFDNRSSQAVAVYKMPLTNSNYRSRLVKTLASGDSFGTTATDGAQYLISSGSWYRAVESIKVGSGWQRRVVVSDTDLRAIGTRRVTTRFTNRSGGTVVMYKVVGSEEVRWASLRSGQSLPFYSFERRQWVVRDASGRLIQRSTTPAASSSITIRPPELDRGGLGGLGGGLAGGIGGGRGGDGIGRGGDSHDGRDRGDRGEHRRERGDHRDDAEQLTPVSLKITNSGRNAVVVYKKTRFGSRRFGTIDAGRTARVTTAAGETWRLEDAVSFQILRTIVVPASKPYYEIAVSGRSQSSRPTQPVAKPVTKPVAKQVRVRLQNDRRGSIQVYQRDGRSWEYTKRISGGRYAIMTLPVGQQILIKDATTSRELERFSVPTRDALLRIRSTEVADSGSRGSASKPTPPTRKPADRADEQSGSGVRGAILRRILFGE